MISFRNYFELDAEAEYYPEYDCKGSYENYCFNGIKALTYRGADYKGKPTRVFAHIGFPHGCKENLPAVVLIHGGGGHPDDIWIRKWNEKGYAAIAMSTDGYFPSKPTCLYEGVGFDAMVHKLIAPFDKQGYTVGPSTTHLADSDHPIEDQWMYHAVTSVIMAYNLLRDDPRTDNSRIGLCGISWGGIIASTVIGYDDRFAFAVPIYGSGYLGCGHSGLNKVFNVPGIQKWFAEKRFDRVRTPIMWLCWNDDCCFSVNSNSMSYQDTRDGNKNTCLSMIDGMGHSHPCAYNREESYRFAETVISGKEMPRVSAEYREGRVIYCCSEKVKRVRLFYINEKMTYTRRQKHGIHNTFMEQEWQITELDPSKNEAMLPKDAIGKYIEFTLCDDVILTTPYNEFKI